MYKTRYYFKYVDVSAILHDTEPVGTVGQQSLQIPEGQDSGLHGQVGDQRRRVTGKYHQ
jgi:hypothetical protein